VLAAVSGDHDPRRTQMLERFDDAALWIPQEFHAAVSGVDPLTAGARGPREALDQLIGGDNQGCGEAWRSRNDQVSQTACHPWHPFADLW
jgi:hypothetical protein